MRLIMVLTLSVLLSGCATYAKQWVSPHPAATLKEKYAEDSRTCASGLKRIVSSARIQAYDGCMESLGYTVNWVEVKN